MDRCDEALEEEEAMESEAIAATDRSGVARNCLETIPNPRLAKFMHLYAMIDGYCFVYGMKACYD